MGFVEPVRSRLGRIGVWLHVAVLWSAPIEERARLVRRIEAARYRSLRIGETPGGTDVFA
ncbi:hypothetical protein [Nonomuraea sp. LPB2021202275-12-8]|uniref:hypothetical protein n=1 Tax=Nonomuraea sp. LPB2021202275-12-8 TaxID=3120159 RepID=UPI00300C4D14